MGPASAKGQLSLRIIAFYAVKKPVYIALGLAIVRTSFWVVAAMAVRVGRQLARQQFPVEY
jgi:hypothetical protein